MGVLGGLGKMLFLLFGGGCCPIISSGTYLSTATPMLWTRNT